MKNNKNDYLIALVFMAWLLPIACMALYFRELIWH